MRSRAVGPLIGKLQAQGREIVDAEIARALAKLPDLSDRDRQTVEKLGRAVMQKLLHQPMANVRRASTQPIDGFDGPVLADALAALFALTEDPEPALEPATEPEAVPRPEPS
jgi:glutamyl-tRNA reductase